MDRMKYDACSIHAYFFSSVNLYGWYRTLMKVSSVNMLIFFSILPILEVVVFVNKRLKKRIRKFMVDHTEGWDHKVLNHLHGTLTLCGRIQPILAVELTIRWNNIEGISSLGSTGQLLPLVISVAGLIAVVCSKYFSKEMDSGESLGVPANQEFSAGNGEQKVMHHSDIEIHT